MIIALASQAQNGKDSASNYLCDRLNSITSEKWHRAAFAYNVKRIFCETFGVSFDFIEEWKVKNETPPGFNMPIRRCLTFIGDGFRDINQDIWVNLLLNENKKNIIISDTRYLSELKRVREEGGISILLWRPGYENDIPNRSEQELMPYVHMLKEYPDGIVNYLPFDIWIKNDSTKESLYNKIDNIVLPYIMSKV